MLLREIILLIHILAACLWVGGMLFMVFVLAPYARKLPNKNEAFLTIGKRFSLFGTFLALPILLITGIFNLNYDLGSFKDIFKFQTDLEKTGFIKFHLFFVILLIALAHDLYFGKRPEKYSTIARVIALLNLLLSIVMIFLGIRIRFGY